MTGPISGKKGRGMPNQLGEESLIAGGSDISDLPSPLLIHPPPPCYPPLVLKPPTLYLQSSPPHYLFHPPPLPPSCGPPLPSTDTQLEYPVSHPSQVLRPAIPPHLVLAVLPSRDDHVVDRAPVNLEHNNKRHSNEKGSVSVGCRRERQH